ncbi:hypothetical protein OG395_05800 [Streptomyces sp. NBC_01320]|nr:hypothetical protein OG395_05800 [Streptomyces sp. NBC_01320]
MHHRTSLTEADLARFINPIIRGWMAYYGAFCQSALYPLLERVNAYVMRWMRKKFKRLRGRKMTAAVAKSRCAASGVQADGHRNSRWMAV